MTKSKLTDEELAVELRDRGHTGAATALERKLTAERAVEGRRPVEPDGGFDPRGNLMAGYAETDGREALERRKARRRLHDGGGRDGE